MTGSEIVLRGGRVIDPQSAFDAVADVAIGRADLHARPRPDRDGPARRDQATYTDSTRPSAGIRHVLVNGTFVVRDGLLVADSRPGRPVRAEPG
jgi:N-acyl-D-aspartate/D-glutamate deacylase